MSELLPFSHVPAGLCRFPPNVEQVSVRREGPRLWLRMRRNDTVLDFPLEDADCRYLAALLLEPPSISEAGEAA